MGEDNLWAQISRDALTYQLAIGVIHIETVFPQQRLNFVFEGNRQRVQYFLGVRRTNLIFAQLIEVDLVNGAADCE
jgi:hypothetical protein